MTELSDAEERLSRLFGEPPTEAVYGSIQDPGHAYRKDLVHCARAHLATIQRARLPITPERLKEVGFEESVHACGTKSLTKGRVSVMLLGECSFAVQFNNVFCHPQPQNMEDIARLSRNTNPSGGE